MAHVEQGLAIRGARLERKLTQAHLAGIAGVSEKSVRRAEAGENLAPDTLRALCSALELDAADLRTEAELRPDAAAEIEAALEAQVATLRTKIRVLTATTVAMVLVFARADDWRLYAAVGWFGTVAIPVLATGAIVLLAGLAFPSTRARAREGWKRLSRGLTKFGDLAHLVMTPLMVLACAIFVNRAIHDPALPNVMLASGVAYIAYSEAGDLAYMLLGREKPAYRPGRVSRWIIARAEAMAERRRQERREPGEAGQA